MFINTTDEKLKEKFLTLGYSLINEKHDITGKTIWVFNDILNRFLIDIKDEDIKSKCFCTDRLTMSF